jgi:LmbE family N-acetylglucosaminyl deacetylase
MVATTLAAARARRPLARVPWPLGEAEIPPLGRRLLVVSPHLDDAAFSLGVTLARHVRAGGEVSVLTVMAGDPSAQVAAGAWDRAMGFRTAGEAARHRRSEDNAAWTRLGVTAVHLAIVDEQYSDGRDWSWGAKEVLARAPGFDEVLLPGHPLRHADHRKVTEAVLAVAPPGLRVRLYAEEPYATWSSRPPDPLATSAAWARRPAGLRDLLGKARLSACYWSQLPLLASPNRSRDRDALRVLVMMLVTTRVAGEAVTAPFTITRTARDAPVRQPPHPSTGRPDFRRSS